MVGIKDAMLEQIRRDADALYSGDNFSDERFKRFLGGAIGMVCIIADGYQDADEIATRIEAHIQTHAIDCSAKIMEKPMSIREALFISISKCPIAAAIVVSAFILRSGIEILSKLL